MADVARVQYSLVHYETDFLAITDIHAYLHVDQQFGSYKSSR